MTVERSPALEFEITDLQRVSITGRTSSKHRSQNPSFETSRNHPFFEQLIHFGKNIVLKKIAISPP